MVGHDIVATWLVHPPRQLARERIGAIQSLEHLAFGALRQRHPALAVGHRVLGEAIVANVPDGVLHELQVHCYPIPKLREMVPLLTD